MVKYGNQFALVPVTTVDDYENLNEWLDKGWTVRLDKDGDIYYDDLYSDLTSDCMMVHLVKPGLKTFLLEKAFPIRLDHAKQDSNDYNEFAKSVRAINCYSLKTTGRDAILVLEYAIKDSTN